MKTLRAVQSHLERRVDIAPLVFFRVAFGAIMMWEVWRYWSKGWIARYYIEPAFHFTYSGFGWVSPWPGEWMYVHFAVLAILAAFIMIGFAYRASALLFFLGFSYVFLLEAANYLNHFYLIALIAGAMVVVPAHQAWSVDAWLRPRLRRSTQPRWSLWLLRFHVGIAYFGGGVAKLNADWLAGKPMDEWLAAKTDFPVIGQFFAESWAPHVFSWGGMLFDLLIVPALLWKRTRIPAVLAVAAFHVTNSELFSIGIFPWFMLAATPIFFGTPWKLPFWLHRPPAIAMSRRRSPPWRQLAWGIAGVYLLLHIWMPLRHFAYPGNPSWTEEGHNFAWHMKLRDKNARTTFRVTDKETGDTWEEDGSEYLSARQRRKMSTRPYLMLQFARHLEHDVQQRFGRGDLEVNAIAVVSLNGRPREMLVDPTRDLTELRWDWRPADWLLPLPEHRADLASD